ncbi:MAG: PLP-dependent aspartate aminotransferase family protein [Planctomycetota bacterium]
MASDDLRLESRVIHGGQSADPTTGAVMPPISLSSTYVQESPGQHKGFVYARGHNPTRFAFERALASVESSGLTAVDDTTCGGFAFSSGMAAISTALELIDAGDHIVAMDDLYGGTFRLFKRVRERSQGLNVSYVDMTDLDAVRSAITDRTKMLWIETPTNPLLKLVDLEALAAIGADRGLITVCDNTFGTPMLQRPLTKGMDIVMHSVTKYIGGHSDVIGGALITRHASIAEKLRFMQNSIGSIMGPFDAYLCLRGLKTLAIRVRQSSANAQRVAEWLSKHPKVDRVTYPGLASHPQHDLAKKQMQLDGQPCGGGMITMFLKGGIDESRRFLENVSIWSLAESLGGVESLIEHPAIMTHASIPPENRAALGISDSLVRLSVGIEHVDDLIADLDRALNAV